MIKLRENEEAVSPVIGVILMVAITVILAAVIAAFVFGMGSDVQGTKVVGMQAKIDNSSTNITITISGGSDLSTLQSINITHNNSVISVVSGKLEGPFSVGDVISFKPSDSSGGSDSVEGRLLIVGKWSDGAEQILIDKNF